MWLDKTTPIEFELGDKKLIAKHTNTTPSLRHTVNHLRELNRGTLGAYRGVNVILAEHFLKGLPGITIHESVPVCITQILPRVFSERFSRTNSSMFFAVNQAFLETFTEEEQEAVLLHECGHFYRHQLTRAINTGQFDTLVKDDVLICDDFEYEADAYVVEQGHGLDLQKAFVKMCRLLIAEARRHENTTPVTPQLARYVNVCWATTGHLVERIKKIRALLGLPDPLAT